MRMWYTFQPMLSNLSFLTCANTKVPNNFRLSKFVGLPFHTSIKSCNLEQVVLAISPSKDLSSLAPNNIYRTLSKMVLIILSVIPFCCGVPTTILYHLIPSTLQNLLNSLEGNSNPLSVLMTCLVPYWLFIMVCHFLNLWKVSIILFKI